MVDFSSIAPSYRKNSLVQASAGKMLLDLLALTGKEDILDVGCGAGKLTALLRTKTSGRVVGIDRTEEMIRDARATYGDQGIELLPVATDTLPFDEEFDGIFCNSVFQWFADPAVNLANFYRALRPGGRLAVQAPATYQYCPHFLKAIDYCRKSPELDATFAAFRSPWFFRDTAAEYRLLFEEAGFQVVSCRIEPVPQTCSIDKAVGVFKSGAAAGYLNQVCFAKPLPADFADRVLAGVRESFVAQAGAGDMVDLLFYRLFVLAEKE